MVVVHIQSDAFNAYKVGPCDKLCTERRRFAKDDDATAAGDFGVVGDDDAAWVDETRRPGRNEPFEFPAYGRFGCADCSMNTTTTMLLQVRADFRDDLYPRARP